MSKNTLIISRPAIGKTQKAIEYYIDKIQNGINEPTAQPPNLDTSIFRL